jgi:hypothetical protein
MGLAGLILAAAAMLQAGQAPVRHPQPLPEPLVDPVRVEVRIRTTARTTRLTVLDDAFVIGAVAQATVSGNARPAIEEAGVAITGNADGAAALVVFRLVVSAAQPGLRFRAGVSPGRIAAVEVWNVNDEARPARVAEFTAAEGLVLDTAMGLLRTGGPLAVAPRERLVLAHWYPWWDSVEWAQPHLLDQPLRLYATDSPADVARNLQDVAAAGIDAVIVSWQGSGSRDGFYARGLRNALDAAQQAGLRVSVMLETAAANRLREGEPPDPDVLAGWMTELIDGYASHPAFLKVDGRPVLFAYIWDFAGQDLWRSVLARVRGSGRQLLIMADTTNLPQLALADGLFTYSGTLFEPALRPAVERWVTAGRAWHLLGTAFGERRIAAAAVIPGYDETRLGRATRRVVDREGGAFYDRQWQAALAANPDWIVITSWNEWAENTQIEAGQRFGQAYIWRTQFWSAAFKHAPR